MEVLLWTLALQSLLLVYKVETSSVCRHLLYISSAFIRGLATSASSLTLSAKLGGILKGLPPLKHRETGQSILKPECYSPPLVIGNNLCQLKRTYACLYIHLSEGIASSVSIPATRSEP